MRGLRRTTAFPSASVVKAMLMVAAVRRAAARDLHAHERALLLRMVTKSDNKSADEVYGSVGAAGLAAVARAAGSTRFRDVGSWPGTQLTPADQARFFLRVDRLVPARHRAFALALLAGIIPPHRWGIADAVRDEPATAVYFKSGWRRGLEHQAALIVRGGRRIALAIFTLEQPSAQYGRRTQEGIARRVLGQPAASASAPASPDRAPKAGATT
jgi:hypothetical protein